jgi:phosphoribosyl 1,2-cyclic phosphodiesterase
MASVGLDPSALDAVVVSHGHGDHVSGVPAVCRRLGIPVLTNEGTAGETGIPAAVPPGLSRAFTTGVAFSVGSLELVPFPVPHDTSDPVGFVVTDGDARVCFATDLGSITLDVVHAFSGCDVIVVESNHDETMLADGPYPAFLKKRVASPVGHLSNEDAAELVQGVAHSGLVHLVLAHLSRTNNVPELPMNAVVEALGGRHAEIRVSLGWQDRPTELLSVR